MVDGSAVVEGTKPADANELKKKLAAMKEAAKISRANAPVEVSKKPVAKSSKSLINGSKGALATKNVAKPAEKAKK